MNKIFSNNNFINSNILLLFILLFSISCLSPNIASAKTGQELFQTCIECHGKDGRGNPMQDAPRIAGQYDWYIESTLNKFKDGQRTNDRMKPILKNLNKSDFKKLATYISKLSIANEIGAK